MLLQQDLADFALPKFHTQSQNWLVEVLTPCLLKVVTQCLAAKALRVRRKGSSAPHRTRISRLGQAFDEVTINCMSSSHICNSKYEENIVRGVICIAKSPNNIVKGLDYLSEDRWLRDEPYHAACCQERGPRRILHSSWALFGDRRGWLRDSRAATPRCHCRGDSQQVHPDWSVRFDAQCRDPHRRDITKSTLVMFRRTKLQKAAQPCTPTGEQIASRESISTQIEIISLSIVMFVFPTAVVLSSLSPFLQPLFPLTTLNAVSFPVS